MKTPVYFFKWLRIFLAVATIFSIPAYSYADEDLKSETEEHEKTEKIFLFQDTDGELWASDGNPEGTKMIDINPGRPSFPYGFFRFKDEFYFQASTELGVELWRRGIFQSTQDAAFFTPLDIITNSTPLKWVSKQNS